MTCGIFLVELPEGDVYLTRSHTNGCLTFLSTLEENAVVRMLEACSSEKLEECWQKWLGRWKTAPGWAYEDAQYWLDLQYWDFKQAS